MMYSTLILFQGPDNVKIPSHYPVSVPNNHVDSLKRSQKANIFNCGMQDVYIVDKSCLCRSNQFEFCNQCSLSEKKIRVIPHKGATIELIVKYPLVNLLSLIGNPSSCKKLSLIGIHLNT
jgi:hypothetical protein